MLPFIIGGVLIIAGGILGFIVPRKMKNKNIEIKFMKTIPVSELKEILTGNAGAGLEGYRHYCELKGGAGSDNPQKAPFSEKGVAYYNANLYQVYEETETYRDEKGVTRRRVKRSESLISNQKSSNPIIVEDPASGDRVYIDTSLSGLQLTALKTLDKFEPSNNTNKNSFLDNLKFSALGSRTLGFRMVENTIPIGQALYVLGEAILEGGKINIIRPRESNKPFIVSVKSEEDIVKANNKSANIALIFAILIALAGILIMIFMH
ncbi:MAG: E3 ubiquitin ligase family protein [Actinobacteria bacterium]|nr:E3 ubiquitin ligase family protein [Actinomycetota bacterium]